MEAIPIQLDIIIFGLVATAVSSLIVYYSYKGFNNFRDNAELASTKLALKEEATDAYSVLAGTAMVFSTFTLIGAYALVNESLGKLQYFSEVGGVVFMVGLIYFHMKISQATHEVNEEKEE